MMVHDYVGGCVFDERPVLFRCEENAVYDLPEFVKGRKGWEPADYVVRA